MAAGVVFLMVGVGAARVVALRRSRRRGLARFDSFALMALCRLARLRTSSIIRRLTSRFILLALIRPSPTKRKWQGMSAVVLTTGAGPSACASALIQLLSASTRTCTNRVVSSISSQATSKANSSEGIFSSRAGVGPSVRRSSCHI